MMAQTGECISLHFRQAKCPTNQNVACRSTVKINLLNEHLLVLHSPWVIPVTCNKLSLDQEGKENIFT